MTRNVSGSSVKKVHIGFVPHQSDPKITDALKWTYSGFLPAFKETLFETDDSLKETSALLKSIRTRITEGMIVPLATKTRNAQSVIRPIIEKATLVLNDDAGRMTRITSTDLADFMNGTNKTVISILVNMNHVNYDYTDRSLDILNWAHFTEDDPTPQLPAQPFSPQVLAQALRAANVGQSQPPIDLNNLSQTIATATAAAITKANAASGTSTATSSASAPAPAPSTFVPASGTPQDVQDRWNDHLKGKILAGSTLSLPFKDGYHFHDGRNHVYTKTGQVFVEKPIDEKGLSRIECFCTNNTRVGIRTWYIKLCSDLFNFGIYCHPLWCFRSNHGGARGFTIGSTTDDDLPLRYIHFINQMKGPLFRFLSKGKMFPEDSKLKDCVAGSQGDGYVALCNILQVAHPVFHEDPSSYMTSYPKQEQGQTLFEYYNIFCDFQWLQAVIRNIVTDLDTKEELAIFISGLIHRKYLTKVTRDERNSSALAHLYKGQQLLTTLSKKLTAMDSPEYRDPRADKPPKSALRINPVSAYVTDAEDDDEGNYNSDYTLEPDTDDDAIDVGLNAIEVPNDQTSEKLFAHYETCIRAIKADNKKAYTSNCIVCQQVHSFSDCPILKDVEFLQRHYIGFCQQLKKDKANREKIGHGDAQKGRGRRPGNRPGKLKKAQVHFLDSLPALVTRSSAHWGSDDSSSDEEDFHQARI